MLFLEICKKYQQKHNKTETEKTIFISLLDNYWPIIFAKIESLIPLLNEELE